MFGLAKPYVYAFMIY